MPTKLAFCTGVLVVCLYAHGSAEAVDYLYPKDDKQAASSSSEPVGAWGTSTTYTAFNGTQHALVEYSGVHTSWLLDSTWVAGLSENEIRDLVDRTDILFTHYWELFWKQPDGQGLLRIAVVPSTCGSAGCGWIARKGIEIASAQLAGVRSELRAGFVGSLLTHEMAHNFDLFHDHITYTADPGHAWTAFLEPYMGWYGRSGWKLQPPAELKRASLDATFLPWIRTAGVTWQTCVRDGSCGPLGVAANDAWAGIFLWYAQVYGDDALARAFAFLVQKLATTPPATPEAKEDLRLQALEAGAQTSIRCAFVSWKWRSLGEAQGCPDSAGVTWATATADPANGIDDNRDLIVDNGIYVEPVTGFVGTVPVSYPATVLGRSTGSGVKTFQFTLAAKRDVRLALRLAPPSQRDLRVEWTLSGPFGWSGTATISRSAATSAYFSNVQKDLPAGTYTWTVTMPEGAYTLNVFDAVPDPGTWAITSDPVVSATSIELKHVTQSLDSGELPSPDISPTL